MSLPNGTRRTSPSGCASDSGTKVWRMPNRPVVTAPHAGRSSSSRYSSSKVPILSPSRSTTVRPRQSNAVSMSSGGMVPPFVGVRESATRARREGCGGQGGPTPPPGWGDGAPGRVPPPAHPGEETPPMSTALIIVIVAIVILLLVLLALSASRKRQRARRQGRVEARARGAEADRRSSRAEELEAEAQRFQREADIRAEAADAERSEAERHAARAREVDPDS